MGLRDDVRRYLNANFDQSEEDVDAAMVAHEDIIQDAAKMGSYPYYPGNRIADAEGWGPAKSDEDAAVYDGTPGWDEEAIRRAEEGD